MISLVCLLMSPTWSMAEVGVAAISSLRGQHRAREGRRRLLAPRCFTALVMKIKNYCSEGSNIRDLLLTIGLVLSSIWSCRLSPSQQQVIEFQVPKVSVVFFPFYLCFRSFQKLKQQWSLCWPKQHNNPPKDEATGPSRQLDYK